MKTITQKRKPGPPEKAKRNQTVANLIRFTALSYTEIGKLFGITKQAVGKIAKRWGCERLGNHHQKPPEKIKGDKR